MINDMSHDRALERHGIAAAVDVYDNLRDVYIGRLVNIHSEGLMVIGDIRLEEDKLYKLDLHLPEHVNGRNTIHLGVDCLWTRNADHNDKHWAGFTIIDISPQGADDIRALVELLGES